MNAITRLAGSVLMGSALLLSTGTFAGAQTAGQDMHAAGTDTKDAAKDVGHGVAHGTSRAYHATKRGTKRAYHKTKRGTKRVVNRSARATERGADKVADKSQTTTSDTTTNPQ